MGQLKANDKDVVHEEEGNIVVVNTCGFIDNAKEESVNTILEQIEKKESGAIDQLFVTGCLSERYKPDLEKEMPQVVDGFMVSETPTLKQHDTLPSSSVEYYFDINVDHEADKEDICKHAEVLNRESYYIDLDFDCEVERDDDLYYYDIYGTEGEPEICLD